MQRNTGAHQWNLIAYEKQPIYKTKVMAKLSLEPSIITLPIGQSRIVWVTWSGCLLMYNLEACFIWLTRGLAAAYPLTNPDERQQ